MLSKLQGDLLFTLGALGRGADHRTLEAPGKGTEGITLQKRGPLKRCSSVRALLEGSSGSSGSSFYVRDLRTRMVPLKRLPVLP